MTTELFRITGISNSRFYIMPHPAGGEALEKDIFHWKTLGIEVVVSMLTYAEQFELDLNRESLLCHQNGMLYLNFPIKDEVADSKIKTIQFIDQLEAVSKTRQIFLFHCRGGVGRSSMILTLLAARLGVDPDDCFGRISQSRGETAPESEYQRNWILDILTPQHH